jgi:hypothetical protein
MVVMGSEFQGKRGSLISEEMMPAGREEDVEALGTVSKKFLPVLFSLLDQCPQEEAGKIKCLSETISAYASTAPRPFVATLFKKLVQKMLVATQVLRHTCCRPSRSI